MHTELRTLQTKFRRLQKKLSATGRISHGYVQDRGPGAGGPCYQWSRKENNKTVSVALSKDQYDQMKEAIQNWKKIQATLQQLQQISRAIIFHTTRDTVRRKPLSKKVLGIN